MKVINTFRRSTSPPKPFNRGFSLVELLVSITIISILAGMVTTVAFQVLTIAKQRRDVANSRQIAICLLADANERNGWYRNSREGFDDSYSSNTLEVLQGLIDDGRLDDPTVVVAEGFESPKRSELEDRHIGFQYVAGHSTTSPSRLPLLFTRGVELDPTDPEVDVVSPGTSAWGYEGLVVAYVSGSATWIDGKEEGNLMELNSPIGLGQAPPRLVVYE